MLAGELSSSDVSLSTELLECSPSMKPGFTPRVSDPGDQGGSCNAVYDLDSEVTPSLLPYSVGHTVQP